MLNLNTVTTPGVYIDEVSLLPPSVAAVATAIPAFIGYTENDTYKDKPIRVTSFGEFQEKFGKAFDGGATSFSIDIEITDIGKDKLDDADAFESFERTSRTIAALSPFKPIHNLYYGVRWYYDNGGGPCYIVSTGKYTGTVASGSDFITAIGILEEEDEPTLIVVPEAVHLNQAGVNEVFSAAVAQAFRLKDRFALIDVPQPVGSVQNDVITEFQANVNVGDHPEFAAAYYPLLETTVDIAIEGIENKIKITHIQKLENGNNSQDPDPELKDKTLKEIQDTGNQDLLAKQIEQTVQNMSLILPPSPAMAGIYTRVDNDRGVWKAPANVTVARVVTPTVKITDATQATMNVDPNGGKSVNAIRTFAGNGVLVWGARTMNGNDNEWRYISVRRFFNNVEESVRKATRRFVFEPNDANTWNSIRAMIENFLTVQWNLGALQGAKPDQAFFVKVGPEQTDMTVEQLNAGFLIVEIGMAVVRPAEFIILRFMHKLPEF